MIVRAYERIHCLFIPFSRTIATNTRPMGFTMSTGIPGLQFVDPGPMLLRWTDRDPRLHVASAAIARTQPSITSKDDKPQSIHKLLLAAACC